MSSGSSRLEIVPFLPNEAEGWPELATRGTREDTWEEVLIPPVPHDKVAEGADTEVSDEIVLLSIGK
jgi:hypothetical protein